MKEQLLQKLISLKGQVNNPDLFVLSKLVNTELSKILNINYLKNESLIETNAEEIYKDLQSEALLTNYFDYYQILEDMKPGTLVDLGAGYCKGTLLSEYLGLSSRCISIEVERVRVQAARSLLDGHDDLIHGDLLDGEYILPRADAYFMYLPTGVILNSIIKKVINQKIEAIFYIIESHGDFIDTISFYPEIFEELPSSLKVSQQRHDKKIYKFKSKKINEINIRKEDLALENINLWLILYSQEDTYVLIESKVANTNTTRKWKANLKDARIINYNGELSLQLNYPNRILQLETQDKIVEISRV
jgi:hypothetical protein